MSSSPSENGLRRASFKCIFTSASSFPKSVTAERNPAAFSEISEKHLLRIVCAGFFLSRSLSGIGVVTFPSAKKEGMLFQFADTARKNLVRSALCVQAVMCIGFMLWQSLWAGGIAAAVALGVFAYYYIRSKKELGGVTGDTAGYFVLLCEAGMVVSTALMQHLG